MIKSLKLFNIRKRDTSQMKQVIKKNLKRRRKIKIKKKIKNLKSYNNKRKKKMIKTQMKFKMKINNIKWMVMMMIQINQELILEEKKIMQQTKETKETKK